MVTCKMQDEQGEREIGERAKESKEKSGFDHEEKRELRSWRERRDEGFNKSGELTQRANSMDVHRPSTARIPSVCCHS